VKLAYFEYCVIRVSLLLESGLKEKSFTTNISPREAAIMNC